MTTAPDAEPEKMYSPEEVAELFSMKPSTIRTWIKEGKLTAIKIGNRWRVPKSAVVDLGNRKFG
jgi:excisionase family DNA binding protein